MDINGHCEKGVKHKKKKIELTENGLEYMQCLYGCTKIKELQSEFYHEFSQRDIIMALNFTEEEEEGDVAFAFLSGLKQGRKEKRIA